MNDPHLDLTLMRLAILEGESARGGTGDNPWVGCVITSREGKILGRGHTQGPGEHHAEIAAAHDAASRGHDIRGATLYSTLEPCAFHGRTPSCARSIAARGIGRVVIGMRDPHPRVDGAGIHILQEAGIKVNEGVCEEEVRRQLGPWVIQFHPHDVLTRTRQLATTHNQASVITLLAHIYGVSEARVREVVEKMRQG